MALPPFDPDKERRNLAQHGISLTRTAELTDTWSIYSPRGTEERWMRFGWLDETLYVAIVTLRDDADRYISLRRASRRERKEYARAKAIIAGTRPHGSGQSGSAK